MYAAPSMRCPAVHGVVRLAWYACGAWVHLPCNGTRVVHGVMRTAWVTTTPSLPGHSSVQDIRALIAIEEPPLSTLLSFREETLPRQDTERACSPRPLRFYCIGMGCPHPYRVSPRALREILEALSKCLERALAWVCARPARRRCDASLLAHPTSVTNLATTGATHSSRANGRTISGLSWGSAPSVR